MKRLLLIALVLFLACEDKIEKVVEHPLVGIWEMTSFTRTIESLPELIATMPSDNTNSFILVINSDSTYAFNRILLGDSLSGGGIWSTNDDTLYTDTTVDATLYPKQLYSFQSNSLFLLSEGQHGVYNFQIIIRLIKN